MIVPGFVHKSPKIDGKMENLWSKTKVVSHFTQEIPDEGKPATESTKVYIMTDNKNFYVFFKCYADKTKLIRSTRKWDDPAGDLVLLYLDTFGDGRTCYSFVVSSAGTQGDAIRTKGGEVDNKAWNGVWFASSRITTYGYSVEIKIPFKSIKYGKGKWGIQFGRYIPKNKNNASEMDYWMPVKRYPGFRISQFAELDSIKPEVRGLNLDLYPVGAVKYNGKLHLAGGMDISYNPNDMFNLNMTIYPDYAQIEADPFEINLSKYALYLPEKRPFFTNGQELFALKNNSNGINGIDVLYTRNIGRVINDTIIVPVQVGTKIITKGKGFDGDIMLVKTGSAGTEPSAYYMASRLDKQIIPGLTTGLIYTGKESSSGYTRILTMEDNFISGYNSMVLQGSYADSIGNKGKGLYFNWSYSNPSLMLGLTAKYIDSTYDINEIGYNTMKGKVLSFNMGHIFLPKNKPITQLGIIGASYILKAWEDKDYSKAAGLSVFSNFRNGNEMGIDFTYNDEFITLDTTYIHCKAGNSDLYFDSYISKYLYVSCKSGMSYDYNYYADHLGYSAYLKTKLSYKPNQNLDIDFMLNGIPYWLENASFMEVLKAKSIEDMYLTANSSVDYYFSPKLMLAIRGEATWNKNINKIYEYKINPLIAYNFSSKSWFYLVYSLSKNYDFNDNDYKTVINVGEVKLRYFLYF